MQPIQPVMAKTCFGNLNLQFKESDLKKLNEEQVHAHNIFVRYYEDFAQSCLEVLKQRAKPDENFSTTCLTAAMKAGSAASVLDQLYATKDVKEFITFLEGMEKVLQNTNDPQFKVMMDLIEKKE